MTGDALRFAVAAGVARIAFDRPEAANSIDHAVAADLAATAERCRLDPAVRCVVLTGSGPFFCAGGDVTAFAERGDDLPAYLSEVATLLHLAVSRLARSPAPVIAAVNGTAAGAGFSLACAADLVLAVPSARFVMSYTGIGLSPDGSATWFLPRLVGLRRALELALTNRVLSAEEAEEWGIVTRVVAEGALEDEADRLAARLASGPTAALGRTAALLRASSSATLETHMEEELGALVASGRDRDAIEGIAAFVEKRGPRFIGKER